MSIPVADPPPRSPVLAARLARLLARIGRELRYHTRAARHALEITHSEAELLRLLDRRPGIRVHDAATELGVASNSVSTLVKQLSGAGLVERATDPLDGRAVCLLLTPLARRWITELGNAREQMLERALASLDAADRARLEAAMPALERLARALANPSGSAE